MSYKIYPKILIYISLYIKIKYKKMTTDPGEDIIKILYGPFEANVYSIMKAKKKLTEPELKQELDNNKDDLDKILSKLCKEDFIEITQKELPPDPKIPRRPKGANRVNEIKFNEKYEFNSLYEKYKYLKKTLEEDFKQKEEEVYFCQKCGDKFSENLASRKSFICEKCKIKFSKNEEDFTGLKNKCKELCDILDDRFTKKLDNVNQETYSNSINYLKAKYGNNIVSDNKNVNNQNYIFEDENDPYIESTLNDLEKKQKSDEKFIFYELIEAFNRCKKK